MEPWTDYRIREAFIDDGGLSEYHDPINGARDQRRIAGAIFDEWLAERDRQERAGWADYFENWGSKVGHPPFTQEAVVSALRGPRPFGAASSMSHPSDTSVRIDREKFNTFYEDPDTGDSDG